MILVSKTPIEDIGVFKDYQQNIVMLFKGGEIYKNII